MTDVAKTELEIAREKAEAEAKLDNDTRTGVGTRLMVGQTRGKGTMVIKYEHFDETKPDTLPTTMQMFMDVTKIKDESSLVERLILGHNELLYTAASDPLAEFVEDSWPDEAKTQFRLVVRNYSRGAMVSLDDAVALIKPGFAKQFEKKA